MHDLLTLDPISGVLTLGQKLDRESTPSLFLVVRATDQAVDPSQRRWGSVTTRMFVTDENDNAPVFSSPSAVSVMEDQPVGWERVTVAMLRLQLHRCMFNTSSCLHRQVCDFVRNGSRWRRRRKWKSILQNPGRQQRWSLQSEPRHRWDAAS